jgi:undecaprenyl-diphosphatase
MPPATDPAPRLRDAALLGLLHGPAELLPISSSGHATLLPWLLGLPYSKLPSERRKAIEVALHAGTAAALVAAPPATPVDMPPRTKSLALSVMMLAPTAAFGLLGRRVISKRLGTPATVAAGLAAGSAALVFADSLNGKRTAVDFSASDALLIGVAQAPSLWPGVSRSAMTITAARARGFAAADAARISRSGVVPASFAAVALEAAVAVKDGGAPRDLAACGVAAAAAFCSTIASRGLVGRLERGTQLWPWAVLRCTTATATVLRIRSNGNDGVQ